MTKALFHVIHLSSTDFLSAILYQVLRLGVLGGAFPILVHLNVVPGLYRALPHWP